MTCARGHDVKTARIEAASAADSIRGMAAASYYILREMDIDVSNPTVVEAHELVCGVLAGIAALAERTAANLEVIEMAAWREREGGGDGAD